MPAPFDEAKALCDSKVLMLKALCDSKAADDKSPLLFNRDPQGSVL